MPAIDWSVFYTVLQVKKMLEALLYYIYMVTVARFELKQAYAEPHPTPKMELFYEEKISKSHNYFHKKVKPYMLDRVLYTPRNNFSNYYQILISETK